MKGLVIGVAAVVASAGAVVLALSFWLTGGFEKMAADRAVANRGYVASEPLTAPGFRALKVPNGWTSDRRALYQRLAPQEGPLTLTVEGDARTFLTLGLYYHAGGEVTRGAMMIAARASTAPPWTPPVLKPLHYGDAEPVQLAYVEPTGVVAPPLQLFYLSSAPPGAPKIDLVLHDPSRGVRVDLRTTSDLYTFEQAAALAESVLQSVEPNRTAIEAAPRDRP